MASPHSGSDFDDFLRDEDLYERATETAIMRVVAWQLKQEMAVSGISKVEMAARMNTSRSQLDRILNGEDENIGIETIGKAARAVGKKLVVELV
ncbi:MAG: XRE family transcriptional regulator [Chloroflexia bacterium]|jgi:DNA-binding Xre family transcriptional regulator|nr:XRE family transcriptional regulator [Chloroflexia bacterium]